MSVNVNTVYTRVLAISNKEQRGYITPQEFNIFANQAQMDIFEQYFYDLNQFIRLPGNSTVHADMVKILEEKIDIFEKFNQDVTMSSGGVGTLPDYYRMGDLFFNNSGTYVKIDKIKQNKIYSILNSPLTSPTVSNPVYINTSSGTTAATREKSIQVYPTTITSGVTCNLIATPTAVEWAGGVVNGVSLYNSSSSVNFDLHASEETELVIKILELAGVSTKQSDIAQYAAQKDVQGIQQEKA
jgi:hypothetical protein|tara:strand:- start:3691 stop:4416 length:726 start_codon:yes stop_codon:yes gene_type:complete